MADEASRRAARAATAADIAGPAFTGSARRVIARAGGEARRLRRPYLGPEHILLSLAGRPDAQVSTIFFNLGISPTRLHQTLSDLVGAGLTEVVGDVRLTADAIVALERSGHEASRLGHRFVAPQHLLLGLAHEPATVAAQVLAQFGAGLEEVRRETAGLPVPLRQRIPWRWRYLRPRRRRRG